MKREAKDEEGPAMKAVPGGVTAARGFKASGVRCGLKEQGEDLALVFSEAPAAVAGMFTTNRFRAAAVQVSQERAGRGAAQAVVINSGNANACTGETGLRHAREMTEIAALLLGIKPELVLVCSTGVIGRPLPMDRVQDGIHEAVKALSAEGGGAAARAIMTTDTAPKEAAVEFEVGGKRVRLGGMAKGAGMIAPNLATMICVLTTDAAVPLDSLDLSLRWAVERSFNCITVDGDMSTNDTVLLLANGASGAPQVRDEKATRAFEAALEQVTSTLARALVADGEGATKLIEVRVQGTHDYETARKVAMRIANSPLVKTALFGQDPNWGRILAAAGGAGVEFDPRQVRLSLGRHEIVRGGEPTEADPEALRKALQPREVTIALTVGDGPHGATVWTCDLTYDYVRINAEYHT
jgi:glutamate N-acetyltransferase/amino-acid N-acetyltransferase